MNIYEVQVTRYDSYNRSYWDGLGEFYYSHDLAQAEADRLTALSVERCCKRHESGRGPHDREEAEYQALARAGLRPAREPKAYPAFNPRRYSDDYQEHRVVQHEVIGAPELDDEEPA